MNELLAYRYSSAEYVVRQVRTDQSRSGATIKGQDRMSHSGHTRNIFIPSFLRKASLFSLEYGELFLVSETYINASDLLDSGLL